MDKQERRQAHFNKAYLGVIAQGEPATAYSPHTSSGLRCVYLADNGSKCAVGHLLSEEELQKYGDVLGGVDDLWDGMYLREDADHDHPFYEDARFYDAMQNKHDNLMGYSGTEFVEAFKQEMASFARFYNLTVPDETATA